MKERTSWDYTFYILALCVFGGFAAHFYAIIDPTAIPNQSLAEHIFWVFANLIACYFIINRVKWFVPVLFVWLLQQLYFHGGIALEEWTTNNNLAITDIAVVIFMPILFICYTIDQYK